MAVMKTANNNQVHTNIDQDDVCIIKLGRKHQFNILPVVMRRETEKAIQFGSILVPRHGIWFPKKALKECKEVPGVFNLAPWFSFDSWGSLFLSSNMRRSMSTLEF